VQIAFGIWGGGLKPYFDNTLVFGIQGAIALL